MAVNYNTTPVNRGLLFSCDFANIKNYSKGQENLFFQSQTFDNASWSKINTNPTPISQANPFGETTGVYTVSNTVSALSYFYQTVYLSNSTQYTLSLYVKPIVGTGVFAFETWDGASSGSASFNLNNLTTSGIGTNSIQSLSNGWYRLISTFTTGATGEPRTQSFYVGVYGSTAIPTTFYIYGAQLERSSSVGTYTTTTTSQLVTNTVNESVSGLVGALYNPSYYYYDSTTNSMQFDRSPVTVTGGFAQFSGSESLTASNFFYNDHTMEIFAKINTYSASGINVNEGSNALFVYQGYHAGFQYDAATGLYYGLWGASPIVAPNWVYPTRPTAGTWFHAVATRSGTTTTIYLNGEAVSSSSYTINGNPGITNNIKIGAGNPLTGPYASYVKMNASVARLYNTALTAAEVKQNFNAYRGRGGI